MAWRPIEMRNYPGSLSYLMVFCQAFCRALVHNEHVYNRVFKWLLDAWRVLKFMDEFLSLPLFIGSVLSRNRNLVFLLNRSFRDDHLLTLLLFLQLWYLYQLLRVVREVWSRLLSLLLWQIAIVICGLHFSLEILDLVVWLAKFILIILIWFMW